MRAALGKVGRSGGAQGMAHTGTPWWSHGLFLWVVRMTVGEMGGVALGRNLVMHRDIRRRALAKAEREAKKAAVCGGAYLAIGTYTGQLLHGMSLDKSNAER